MTQSCLVTKKNMNPKQGSFGSGGGGGVVTNFYAPTWLMGFCVFYYQTIILVCVSVWNGVYQYGQDVVWSQKVCWKCIFQGSGDLNVKIFPFTAHHGGTSWDTDFAKSKETKSREQTAVNKSACIKACKYILLLY